MPSDDALCVLCPPPRPDGTRQPRQTHGGSLTCLRCASRLSEQLDELAQRFPHITAEPVTGTGGRRAPGFGPRIPINAHNASLRDPRTAPNKVGELHSPINFLVSWAGAIRGLRDQSPVAYLPGNDDLVVEFEARYLRNALDWATRQEWIWQFSRQMSAVLAQVRSATGDRRPRKVGRCTKDLDGTSCNHPIFPPREGSTVTRCGSCGHPYDLLSLVRMVSQEKENA